MRSPAVKVNMRSQLWRLENLYWIVDEDGNKVRFKLRKAQRKLLATMHWRNIILKARQLGFTTFVCIFALDLILFTSNVSAGFVAHKLDDAQDIFYNKIKFAYNNLPESLKARRPALKNDAGTLIVDHGDGNVSRIRVGTSLRSGTYQLLHISEHGKICADYPKKAKEIKTGTLPTAHNKAFVFIESTAEGKVGDFFDFCCEAQETAAEGKKLSNLDFKFHFFPWFDNPENRIDPEGVEIPKDKAEYFATVEADCGVTLEPEQKAWYVKTAKKLGDDMCQEHPSTPEEAFNKPVDGAYYAKHMAKARADGRIRTVAHDPAGPVYTFWDLGLDDSMCIWFAQFIAGEIRIIDYYENSEEALGHYIKVVKEKEYVYADHFAPHDIKQRELSTGISRLLTAKKLGLNFRVLPAAAVVDGIEAVRGILGRCWFDREKCERGIVCLENYRKKYSEALERYEDRPLHNWASHAADGFRYLAMAYRFQKIDGRFHNRDLDALNRNEQVAADWDPFSV